jgi:glycerol-3-phosphate O-acyltransferase/dihydroxyacetone phosphate acyltransferase
MELKLIYRALRQLSEWTVSGFYSELHIEGASNVPKGGHLILASTHHNEIIDIAVLAITIPHRRHISF